MTGGSPFYGKSTGAGVGENGSGTTPESMFSIVKTCKHESFPIVPGRTRTVARPDEEAPFRGLSGRGESFPSSHPIGGNYSQFETIESNTPNEPAFRDMQIIVKDETGFQDGRIVPKPGLLKNVNTCHGEGGNRLSQAPVPVAILERFPLVLETV